MFASQVTQRSQHSHIIYTGTFPVDEVQIWPGPVEREIKKDPSVSWRLCLYAKQPTSTSIPIPLARFLCLPFAPQKLQPLRN